MSKELSKTYNAGPVESKIYKLWEDSGLFSPEKTPEMKDKFVTCIAPPNITGELHLGHALELTLQDIIVRMKRMQGYKTLWVPGIDHAGIGAQNVVEKQLTKEGLKRQDLGREKFEQRVQEWKEKYGTAILDQFKKLGISVDWTRTRYTRDEQYEQAVKKAFNHYYKKGWIYKGERVINWCPRCATSISDLEVNYVPEAGKLYFIKYGPFSVATARPETRLGDTGLAVHPEDPRYKDYLNKEIEIETVNSDIPLDQPAKSKKIKLFIKDDFSIDKEFGTGVVKITPAHDMADAEIGRRNNLPSITVIDEHAKMNENAGLRYKGLKTSQARKQIIKDLETLGLIEKVENYNHNVGRCDRCNAIIEPLPSKQWFFKMEEPKKLALEAIDSGKIIFHPARWATPYRNWLNNLRDWNISRQIWWGHKIPVEGEEDVLDTWFSSALWPFAALGWPNEQNPDYKEYYPTNFITSARDILYLWIVRMIFSGIELTGKAPFHDIYIHATVLTKDGKRMSKSLGTGINPIGLIEKYGADALRFGLASQASGLQDIRFGEDTMIMGKKFANKVWNVARYIIMKLGDDFDWNQVMNPHNEMSVKISSTTINTTNQVELYNFAEAASSLYHFVWHELADKYIEETKSKDDAETKNSLAYALITCLKLLHPFMPFITEEIFGIIQAENRTKFLMVQRWPVQN